MINRVLNPYTYLARLTFEEGYTRPSGFFTRRRTFAPFVSSDWDRVVQWAEKGILGERSEKSWLLMGGWFYDLIFFELVIEGASADSQTLCRLLFIPTALL